MSVTSASPTNKSVAIITPPTTVTGDFLTRYLISATASVTSEILTFPLDTIKTYRQLHSSHATTHTSHKLSMYNVRHLYDGVNAAVARSLCYGGLGMLLYVPIRDIVAKIDLGTPAHTSNSSQPDLQTTRKLLSGMISGSIAQAIAQPTDVAKAIMQAHGRHIMLNNIHGAVKPGVFAVWSDIIRHEGLRGLWRGWLPSVQRASIINGVWVSTYDSSKHAVRNYLQSKHVHNAGQTQRTQPLLQHWTQRVSCVNDKAHDVCTYVIASQFAALTSAIVAAPTDVIKTRMMTQALSQSGRMPVTSNSNATSSTHLSQIRYTGSLDCFRQTVRQEGVLALFKGAGSSVLRGSPWNAIYFVVFEEGSQRLLGRSQI